MMLPSLPPSGERRTVFGAVELLEAIQQWIVRRSGIKYFKMTVELANGETREWIWDSRRLPR